MMLLCDVIMHQSFATTSPLRAEDSGGIAGLKYPDYYIRGVPVVPWICRAFDSRQNSGGNSTRLSSA